jgi:hypothetical protein
MSKQPRKGGQMDERVQRGQSASAGSEEGVATLVCLTCGTEYYFGEGGAPSNLACEKCGGTVFRRFDSSQEEDDVRSDFRDSTERDLRPDDAEGDALPGDVLDLNQG